MNEFDKEMEDEIALLLDAHVETCKITKHEGVPSDVRQNYIDGFVDIVLRAKVQVLKEVAQNHLGTSRKTINKNDLYDAIVYQISSLQAQIKGME